MAFEWGDPHPVLADTKNVVRRCELANATYCLQLLRGWERGYTTGGELAFRAIAEFDAMLPTVRHYRQWSRQQSSYDPTCAALGRAYASAAPELKGLRLTSLELLDWFGPEDWSPTHEVLGRQEADPNGGHHLSLRKKADE